MKIIHLSTSDSGGAGKFIYNLHKAMIKNNHNSCLLVKEKNSKDSSVIQISKPFIVTLFYDLIGYLYERYFPEYKTDPNYYFYNKVESFTKFPAKYINKLLPYKPDIILVGWISGFVNFKTLYDLKKQTGAKIVFYFADMGNLTGGCHYDMFCNKYTTDCKSCPAIFGKHSATMAHKNLMLKKKYINLMSPNVFPGTNTLRQQALKSFLFKEVPLFDNTNATINSEVFNQKLIHVARDVHEIKKDKRVIFIGSSVINEPRKGFNHLLDALYFFKQKHADFLDNIQLLIAGNNLPNQALEKLEGYDIKYLDYMHDEKLLSLAYQASDIYICPTIYDSGPLMVMESLMCGTPVVSFDVGVSSELVITNYTGYKAENYKPEDLANGIFTILNLREDEYENMRINCIKHTTPLCSESIIIKRIMSDLQSIV